ncbi:pentatricopeptide repeat-containing protein [Pyrus ussuriensis x Pyrus communis]|uniref:Pentatricopeptide repeat-containing protein n=1 Tax=Pyrus ussuriensis x Pyrus communis TaxID=2448454 RepID=A0A5N5G427_9ROSA|nr:pentatricopeptide repeat-containing protein [Pyrus ussuriensis x Pyrus communis]
MPIALKVCARLRVIVCGKIIHGFVKKHERITLDMFVGSALIELYSKCGEMGEAVKVFDEFSQPDVLLWTSMVTGYEQNGDPEKALEFFSRMVMCCSACAQLSNFRIGSCVHSVFIRNGFDSNLSLGNALLNLYAKTGSVKTAARIEPNSVRLVSELQVCALAGNLEEGKKIHEIATRKCFELDIRVATALIDMYIKCSALEKADVVSWAALLNRYAHNGIAYKSIGVFRDMLSDQTQPDPVAVVKLLAACSELGIRQQAICLHAYVIKRAFKNNIFIRASLIKLYSKCSIIDNDILLFEGITDKDLDKAMEIVESMPNPATPHVWEALLGACQIHNNTKLGEVAAKSLFRTLIKEKGLKKMSGQSVVEVGSDIPSFVAGDRLHLDSDQIYGVLGKLEVKMREKGYVPNVDLLLHDMVDAV